MIARSIAIAMVAAVALAATARAQFTYDRDAWLGIIMGNVDGGVTIEEVLPGTPAEHSGLEVGDVVTAVAGTPTRDVTALKAAIKNQHVGDEVDIDVRRGKRRLTLSATLASRPDQNVIRKTRLIDRPAPPFSLDVLSGDGSGTLRDYRGKVVVFVSWTLSCSHCLRVFVELDRLQSKYGDRVAVVVAAAAPAFDVRKALEARPLPFTILSDAMGTLHNKYDILANPYDPVMVVIDAQGFVRQVAFHSGQTGRIVEAASALAGDEAAR